jgi:hypothetical protein
MKKWAFPAYLVFTVVIGSYHYIMQWGPAETTLYESDAPGSIKIIKDIVWVGLLVWFVCSKDFHLLGAQIKRTRRLAICCGLFCLWMYGIGFTKLLMGEGSGNVLLYWMRYPLEYIPMAFLVPAFMPDPSRLKRVAIGCCWLVVGFFLYEVIASRESGFGWRYGSIFGSPNDFGIFAAFVVLIFISSGTNWLLAFLMFAGLLGSFSRSSWVGFAVGYLSLLDLKRARVIAVGAVLLWIAASSYAYQKLDLEQFNWLETLGTRVTAFDESAALRQDEAVKTWSQLNEFHVLPWMFGTREYVHVESYYLALIVRAGLPALLLFLAVQWVTLRRAWKFRHEPIIRFALCVILTVSAGSAFIPFPDVFPTNFYFWMAVGIVHTDELCYGQTSNTGEVGSRQPAHA